MHAFAGGQQAFAQGVAHFVLAQAATTTGTTFTDDGVGGTLVPGVGLESLRSRVCETGGTLSIEQAAPRGTRLVLTLDEDDR